MPPASNTRRSTVPAAAGDRTQRRLAQFFMANHALTPEDAIYFSTTTPADEKVFVRMQRGGLIRDAGRKRYYLDINAYDAHLYRRRRLGAIVSIIIALTVAALATFFYV